jgi:hypothetical protein
MMSTGVVVNGYEIRNWHTVSILELARARRKQVQPVPDVADQKMSKRQINRRSKTMTKQISDEQIHAWVVANKRDGMALASLSRASGVSVPTIKARMGKFLEANPAFLASLDAAAVPSVPEAAAEDAPAMDDPEMVAGQEEPTAAANEDLARARARELRAKSSMVIAVQPLSDIPSVLARKQPYDAPRVLGSGSVLEMTHPQAAVKLVERLVASLNQAGVQAYFEWRAEGQTGQPLAR